MKDEKILQKVGKLLLKFGVTDDEAKEFVSQLRDMKDDSDETPAEEEQPAEQPAEQSAPEEKPAEETPSEEQPKEEEKPAEEKPEEKVEEPSEEEVAKESEKPAEEQPTEQKANEEQGKTMQALSARVDVLEKIVSKLGVTLEDEVGLSPDQNVGEQPSNSYFDIINKRRTGN